MKKKLIYGVGINDADYKVKPVVNGIRYVCPFYKTWFNMLVRCNDKKELEKHTTYKNCTIYDEWLTFSNFKGWMEQQDYLGKQLDKDLLIYRNKIYSPETCCFVSKKVNTFLLKCDKSRGIYPLGVDYKQKSKGMINEYKRPYRSRCSNAGKSYVLGYHLTENLAHRAWQKAKAALAFDLALDQTDERVKQGLMRVYEKILSDYENDIETLDF